MSEKPRFSVIDSDHTSLANAITRISSNGTGNSQVRIRKSLQIDLNNVFIKKDEIIEFLEFIEFPKDLEIKLKAGAIRRWGHSQNVPWESRRISLNRPSVWIFLHELAHQYVPHRSNFVQCARNLCDAAYEQCLPFDIDGEDYFYMPKRRDIYKYSSNPSDIKKWTWITPHGKLFGEVLTRLTFAWLYFKGERSKAEYQKSVLYDLQYEHIIDYWTQEQTDELDS